MDTRMDSRAGSPRLLTISCKAITKPEGWGWGLIFLVLACSVAALDGRTALAASINSPSEQRTSRSASLVANYGNLPLSFEKNEGQSDARVKFLARGQGYGLFLTPTAAVLSLQKGCDPKSATTGCPGARNVLSLNLLGASLGAQILGEEELPGRSNYFVGSNPAGWHAGIANFARVKYKNVYPGVDLVYYGNQCELEFDLVVAPGANLDNVRFRLEGAQHFEINAAGDLLVHLEQGDLALHKPVIYQLTADGKMPIDGRYIIRNGEIAFKAGAYDRLKPLVVDPTLVYSTYLGGTGLDSGNALAIDSTGNAYIGGTTTSTDFPTATPIQSSGVSFVTKLNPSGTALVYSTYFGGTQTKIPRNGLAIDSTGNVYVMGTTQSSGFPTMNQITGACDSTCQAGFSTFVTEINASGSALVYSSLVGDQSVGTGIAVDHSGNAYVVGSIVSGNPFPIVNAFQAAPGGAVVINAFLFKVNAGGTSLVYSTYLGGSHQDAATAIAVDSADEVYVTGTTTSTNFPTVGQIAGVCIGTCGNGTTSDVFISKFNAAGSALVYSSVFGGSGSDSPNAIAVDTAGNAYIAGLTTPLSGSTNDFPVTSGVLQPTPNCVGAGQCLDGFVTKIDASGASLGYSTFFGTNGSSPAAIDVDASGDVALGGAFVVPAVSPIVTASSQNLAVLNPGGTALLFSSALATTYGIKFDSAGDLYVTGAAASGLMVTSGAYQTTFKSLVATNAFAAKISNSVPTASLSFTPSTLTFASQVVGTSSTSQNVTLSNTGGAALTISGITIAGTNAGDFSQTNTCGSSLAASATCSISVTFTPTATGSRTASVSIADNATGSPQAVALTGTGGAAAVPAVTLAPTSLTFASQNIGASSTAQSVTLTNSGTAALTITGITLAGANAGDYSQTNTCGSSVAAGANCAISVTFKPTAAGARAASVSIADNATGSPQAIALTGTGATPAPDFSIAASPASVSVTAGSSGTSTLTITPANGFNQSVSFACTGLPSLSTCSFSPTTVTPSGAAITTSVSISTTATTTAMNSAAARASLALAGFIACLIPLARVRRKTRILFPLLVVVAALAAMSGCGGGGSTTKTNPGTPTGTYPITVTATSGSGSAALSHTASVTLTVQ